MSENTRLTTQLKLRPYRDWPPCDGHPRPGVWPALAKILKRGTITVLAEPIESKGQRTEGGLYPLPQCDSPLVWRIAEPDLVGYVCQHCLEESAPQAQPAEILGQELMKGFFESLSLILGTNAGARPADAKNEISDSRSKQVDETERRTPEGDWVN